jgi:segregation and condensation protein B
MNDLSPDLRLVEALLFAAPTPLDEAAIALRLPEGTELAPLLAELETFYRPRGVTLQRLAGGWAFRTAADLGPLLAVEKLVPRKLSRAAIETLAIIAYHQPVTRGEIEEIRGVAISKGTLDTLMEAGWVRPKGRKPTPGRPATWVTTPEFLTHFGLAALVELPGLEELKAAGLLESRPSASLGDSAEIPEVGEGQTEATTVGGEEAGEELAPVLVGRDAAAKEDGALPASESEKPEPPAETPEMPEMAEGAANSDETAVTASLCDGAILEPAPGEDAADGEAVDKEGGNAGTARDEAGGAETVAMPVPARGNGEEAGFLP